MKNLQYAIAALLVLGGLTMVDQAQARCRKDKCYKEVKAAKCEPEECETTCTLLPEEERTYTEKITICVPRREVRQCKEVTKCCKKKSCLNAPWKKQPCTVKVDCGEGETREINLPGDEDCQY